MHSLIDKRRRACRCRLEIRTLRHSIAVPGWCWKAIFAHIIEELGGDSAFRRSSRTNSSSRSSDSRVPRLLSRLERTIDDNEFATRFSKSRARLSYGMKIRLPFFFTCTLFLSVRGSLEPTWLISWRDAIEAANRANLYVRALTDVRARRREAEAEQKRRGEARITRVRACVRMWIGSRLAGLFGDRASARSLDGCVKLVSLVRADARRWQKRDRRCRRNDSRLLARVYRTG